MTYLGACLVVWMLVALTAAATAATAATDAERGAKVFLVAVLGWLAYSVWTLLP